MSRISQRVASRRWAGCRHGDWASIASALDRFGPPAEIALMRIRKASLDPGVILNAGNVV